jgi:hypothetical protein
MICHALTLAEPVTTGSEIPLPLLAACGILSVIEPFSRRRRLNSAIRMNNTALALTLLMPAVSAVAAAKTDPSDAFFASGYIPHIQIEITKTNLDALRRNDRAYVRATVREGTNVWEEVGVHNKGAAGSRRDIGDQPALTLNFDKFIDDQKFHGLDKFSLNNSVQDRSLLCEAICAQLFHDAGVPASRVTHARVTLNGKNLGDNGLYVLKEGFDKTFLRRHFKNIKGNLYDGGFLREITEPLERTSGTGDVKNHADLKALVAAVQDPDPTNRFARLEKLLALDRFIDLMALEVFTWHWDGYTFKHNNYRVYHDPDADKLHFFPHGMDQMFWQPDGQLQPNMEGLVANALIKTPEGRLRYRQHFASLMTNVCTAEKITNHIAVLQSRLQPVLAKINPDVARNQANAARSLSNQILARIDNLNRRLSEPEPKPVSFDPGGVAYLPKWEPPKSLNLPPAILHQTNDPDGRKTLHVATVPGTNCIGSWRVTVLLAAGDYTLEGRVRTAGVVPMQKDVAQKKGIGAGIRISQPLASRPNQLVGDQSWQTLTYDFNVPAGPDEVTLICELRASAGEAWFDLSSLKLRKKSPGPSSPTP